MSQCLPPQFSIFESSSFQTPSGTFCSLSGPKSWSLPPCPVQRAQGVLNRRPGRMDGVGRSSWRALHVPSFYTFLGLYLSCVFYKPSPSSFLILIPYTKHFEVDFIYKKCYVNKEFYYYFAYDTQADCGANTVSLCALPAHSRVTSHRDINTEY